MDGGIDEFLVIKLLLTSWVTSENFLSSLTEMRECMWSPSDRKEIEERRALNQKELGKFKLDPLDFGHLFLS